MNNRKLWLSMVAMLVLSFGGATLALATGNSPVLGLDLQGGFSVVLQAKEVNGRLPSEEAVEKAKDIIRQRVDGLGVAEPDITRQGRTVVVQLPGVKNRAQAESVVGCTAKLEFRPLISTELNPDAPLSDLPTGTEPSGEEGSTTTEAPSEEDGSTDTTEAGLDEIFGGTAGLAVGEGAVPAQFAPTTTLPPTTTSTSTTAPADTTTTVVETTTTAVEGSTATTAPVSDGAGTSSSACGSSTERSLPIDPAEGLPEGSVRLISQDEQLIYTLGAVGMEGDALNESSAVLDPRDGWIVTTSVRPEFRDQGSALFDGCAMADPSCPGRAVAIVLDGEVLSAPTVQETGLASSEAFRISGDFSEREAKELALVLRFGSLPVEFEQAALQQVSATLGSDSLRAGLIAGVIGIVALALYMVLYYRGFGMVVVVSLLVWMALMYAVVCLLSATQGLALTLAGITGMIVSVGTTVDTYVVVFERVKDLVREGKSVRRATELGYQQGIRTVITANGAAFIGAFLLWYLTVGPVRGFAYFLAISVVIDMLVAIAFTRPLILLLSRSQWFSRAKFFGVATSTDQVALGTKAVAS